MMVMNKAWSRGVVEREALCLRGDYKGRGLGVFPFFEAIEMCSCATIRKMKISIFDTRVGGTVVVHVC